MRTSVILRYFEDLFAGNPVALMSTALIILCLALIFLVGIKLKRDKLRRDEEWRRRHGH